MEVITGSGHEPAFIAGQFDDIEKLYNLARDTAPESRAILACEISTILEAEVNERESEMVADVLIELLRQAERDLRVVLSERLSVLERVPLRLVLQLANDEIEVAEPVLEHSSILGDFDLMYIIKSKTAKYWQAIARRKTLSDQVIDVLAQTKDFDTALTLVENKNIALTSDALAILSDIAQGSDILAIPLAQRDDVPQELAAALYQFVGQKITDNLVESNSADIDYVAESVDYSVAEMEHISTPKDCNPEWYMYKTANQLKESNKLTAKLMVTTLRRGHVRTFIAQISVLTDIPAHKITKILMQKSGKGLAVIAKAFDMTKSDFVSIFMLTSGLWNCNQVVNTQQIKFAVEHYNKVERDIALTIINQHLSD